mgnify:CR=1 FL=1
MTEPFEHGSLGAAQDQMTKRCRVARETARAVRCKAGFYDRVMFDLGLAHTSSHCMSQSTTVSLVLIKSQVALKASITLRMIDHHSPDIVFDRWDVPAGVSTRTCSLPLYLLTIWTPTFSLVDETETISPSDVAEAYIRYELPGPDQLRVSHADPTVFSNGDLESFVVSPVDTPFLRAGEVIRATELPGGEIFDATALREAVRNPGYRHGSLSHAILRSSYFPRTDYAFAHCNDYRVAAPLKLIRWCDELRIDTEFDYVDGLILDLPHESTCTIKDEYNSGTIFDSWKAPKGLSFYTGSFPSGCLTPWTSLVVSVVPEEPENRVAQPTASGEREVPRI